MADYIGLGELLNKGIPFVVEADRIRIEAEGEMYDFARMGNSVEVDDVLQRLIDKNQTKQNDKPLVATFSKNVIPEEKRISPTIFVEDPASIDFEELSKFIF